MEKRFGIIFINGLDQTRGRFREMTTRLTVAVFLCWLFIFCTVQSCTIVIKNHGTKLRESTSYWDEVGYSQTTCEAACESDSLCFGYSFDSDSGECMKSTETVSKNANNCPTCSFHSKRCGLDCSVTYTIQGDDKASENPYSTLTKSYPECETSCSSDQNCVGFGYDSSNNQCTLTEYNVVEVTTYSCTTCTMSIKICNGSLGGETTTQNVMTELTTLTSVVTTLSDISTTPDVILTTETTTASNTDIETSTSILSSMEDTTANDQITTFKSPESTTTTTTTTTTFTSPESMTTATPFTSPETTTAPTTTTIFTPPESTTTATTLTSPEITTTTTLTTIFTPPESTTTTTLFASPESTTTTTILNPPDLTTTTTIYTPPESTTTATTFTPLESTTTKTTAFTPPKSMTTTIAYTSPESTTTSTTTITMTESMITTIIPRPIPITNQDTTSDSITTTSETTLTSDDTTTECITKTSETTFTSDDTTTDITTMTTESPTFDKYVTPNIISTTSISTVEATSPESFITTTNNDSISSMSIYFTENNDVNGSLKLCVCQCVYDNITSLEVRIEERKNILKMSKDDLSSFHRRLNCAYDPRNSSKVVGGVGILVLTLIMSLVIIPDIITSVSRLTRKKTK